MKTKITPIVIGLGLATVLFIAVIWDNVKKPNGREGGSQGKPHHKREVVSPPDPSKENQNKSGTDASVAFRLPMVKVGMPTNVEKEVVRWTAQGGSGGHLLAHTDLDRGDWQSWLSPDGSLVLYAHTAEPMKIYNRNAEFKIVLPRTVALSNKTYWVESWLWKNNDALVGIGIHDLNFGREDESDIDDAVIFMVEVHSPNMVVNLDFPPISKGHIVRLEGVSGSGGLILAEVLPFNWYCYQKSGLEPYHEGERLLGTFDVKR